MSPVYIKKNPIPGSESLVCEHRGLLLIKKFFDRHGLHTPKVIAAGKEELHLERIRGNSPVGAEFRLLAERLAGLHRVHSEEFGLAADGFIGLNPQVNVLHANWGEFYVDFRLRIQAGLIRQTALRRELEGVLERHRDSLVRFLNRHNPSPSLLHGDLWSGNVIFTGDEPYVIDPAVYFGDRECDLAISKMFGGFSEEFYQQYQQTYPLPAGHREREIIYQLYHYLNHFNLFGEGYRAGVVNGIKLIQSVC